MKAISGPLVADIAANVLAMTLMVLIAAGRFSLQEAPALPSHSLTPQPVQPVGGEQAVELLRQRLLPGLTGLVDVGPEPVAASDAVSTLYILDPATYPSIQSDLLAQGQEWRELTVPLALIGKDGTWHPDFLALASIADDPDRFRTGLQVLLAQRQGSGGGAGVPTDALAGQGTQIALRFQHWFRTALDLMALSGLFLAFWGLRRLHRWAMNAG